MTTYCKCQYKKITYLFDTLEERIAFKKAIKSNNKNEIEDLIKITLHY